jgi:uncharacterized membrane protein YbhN (UPF0104 family)
MSGEGQVVSAPAEEPVLARPARRFRPLRLLRIVVSLGLLGWVLQAATRRNGFDALLAGLTDLRFAWLGVACLLPCAAVLIGALRWRVLLVEEGLALSLAWVVKHTLIGRFVGAFTPSTTGIDGYRTLAVARKTGRALPASRALLFEKVVGLAGLAAVTSVCAALGVIGLSGPTVWLGVGVCLSVSALGYVVVRKPGRLAALLPVAARLQKVRTTLSELAGSSARSGPLFVAFALGILNHIVTSAVFVAAAWAVHVDLGVGPLFGLGNAIVIATLLPISIGGLGVRELLAIKLLGTLGIAEGPALLVAIVGYLGGQTPAILGGLLSAAGSDDTCSD